MIGGQELTFKHNIGRGRHGWLRLTPAYSIKLVESILDTLGPDQYVVDPFAGTGTTGLVCATRNVPCDLFEINPFLVWLAEAKMHKYSSQELDSTRQVGNGIADGLYGKLNPNSWAPSIRNRYRWWPPRTLLVLSNVFERLKRTQVEGSGANADLLKIAFCKLLISTSNAAFNHQSMSFKKSSHSSLSLDETVDHISSLYREFISGITEEASLNPMGSVSVRLHNSKQILLSTREKFTCVITSPPYCNRISYIRELRPYMYWLGFIKDGREAGDLEWEAIGGTWGIATSRLADWRPARRLQGVGGLQDTVENIRKESPLLANYVSRYFEDVDQHFETLTPTLKDKAGAHYIIGNSKFYDTVVPVEKFYADIMKERGFKELETEKLRRRSSKKELYEFRVSGVWKKD